jgi:hypothetical protein
VLLALLFHWDLQNEICNNKGHNYTSALIFTVKWEVNYNWLYQTEWSQADYQEVHFFFHHPDSTGSGIHLASYSVGNWCPFAREAWRWLFTSIWYRHSVIHVITIIYVYLLQIYRSYKKEYFFLEVNFIITYH